MHLRDQRVLAWIKLRAAECGEPVRITHEEIAETFLCHRLTARAIVQRLIGADLIRVESAVKSFGYTYTVNWEAAA